MKFDLSKIVEYYNGLNDQARYCWLVGAFFFVILIDVVFLVLPQIGGISDVNDQIKKLSEDTQQVLTDKARIGILRKNLQAARLQLGSLNDKVLSIQEVPAILSTISSIANEYGVKIDQLVPEKSQQEVLTKSPDGKYYALPVVIKARCGYHKFGYFLSKLENQDLYFIMKDFIIQNEDNNPSIHLFSLTINIILVDRNPSGAKHL